MPSVSTKLGPLLERLRDICRQADRGESTQGVVNREVADRFAARVETDEACSLSEFDQLEFDRFTTGDLWAQSLSEATSDLSTIWRDLRGMVHSCDATLSEQRRLTQETQNELLRIQMVPLGSVLPRLQRAVREAASAVGKQVQLVVEGEDVELDKMVLEQTVEPLLHLLRNAVDHGVEPGEERAGIGKPPEAVVRLTAVHFGAEVILQVSDDGRGMNADQIRDVAIKKGLLSESDAQAMAPGDLQRLIFLPGFTTSVSVNQISGRGVGMDVVRSTIEALKGRIDVESAQGCGTTFSIRLPVSLAVTQALFVNAGNELFAIPQRAITSIQRIPREDLQSVDGQPRLRVGEVEVPVVRLAAYLGLPIDTLGALAHVLDCHVGRRRAPDWAGSGRYSS